MMKIVLTGGTGFIGSEILKQCIAHPFIAHVYVLTRRPLDEQFTHKKVTQLLHEDFETYSEILLDRLRDEGVEACIWALGGTAEAAVNVDEARAVGINFPIRAATAFANYLAPALKPYKGYPAKLGPAVGEGCFPFRFIFISAWGAEQNPARKLWMFGEVRKIKGAAERGLFDVADKSPLVDGHRCFEVIALRPGSVLAAGDATGTVLAQAVVPYATCTVDRLAASALRTAMFGAEGKNIVGNKECIGDGFAMINRVAHVPR
jgi:hypothetical protein